MQNKDIGRIKELLAVQVSRTIALPLLMFQASTAAILLRHYAWNSEKLQEEFWNDSAKSFHEAGLSPPTSPSASLVSLPSPTRATRPPRRTMRSAVPFDCPICCDVYPGGSDLNDNTYALGCNHRFCRGCWKEYITGKVKGEGESARVQCMESGCNRIVREEAVDELVDKDVSVR
jgi:ariadne-1